MSHIVSERQGAVLVLRLARADKKNALTLAMYEDLNKGLAEAASNGEINAALIIGAPGCFTAGNDIADFVANPPTSTDTPVFRFLEALVNFPKPLLAAVDGPAVGIGTTMLLHCDHVLATPNAKFRMPFVALGLVPEGGSSVLLAERVGQAKANEWLLLGDAFQGEEAYRTGLINELVTAESLEEHAISRAQAYASRPAGAIQASKQLIREPRRAELLATIRREGAEFMARLGSEEAMRALTGFLFKA